MYVPFFLFSTFFTDWFRQNYKEKPRMKIFRSEICDQGINRANSYYQTHITTLAHSKKEKNAHRALEQRSQPFHRDSSVARQI